MGNVAANHLLYEINKSQQYNSFDCKLAGGTIFEFTRHENQAMFSDDTADTSRYIIKCDIKNNIGIVIYTFTMNESDTLRFIDCGGNFLYYFSDTGSNMYIGLPMSNSSSGHYPSFELTISNRYIDEDEFNNMPSIYFNSDTQECRYYDFVVYDAKEHYRENQILKIPMSCSELEDLLFQICLTANINFGEYLDEHFGDADVFVW